MKVTVSLGDQRLLVDFSERAGAQAMVDGEPLDADAVEVRPGLYSLLIGGRSYEITVEIGPLPATAPRARTYAMHVGGSTIHAEAQDERVRHLSQVQAPGGGERSGSEVTTIAAPMPGRVAGVPVSVGDAVERGQPLIILEAMKMESAIGAPHPGTVAEVLVTPGATVTQRQPMLRLQRSS